MTSSTSSSPILATLDRGAGEPVVLLHSGGMSGRQWGRLIDALAVRRRVLAPDLLGSGANPPWPHDAPFDFYLDVDAVLALVRTLGEPAHLVGHSYGGLLALTLAQRAPELVRSLALYEPVAFGILHATGDAEGLADLERLEHTPGFVDEAGGGGEAWFQIFVDYWNGPGAWAAVPEENRKAFLRVGRKVYREVVSLSADRTPLAEYQRMAVPTLLLSGARTAVAERRVVQFLAATLPRATSTVLERAGHMGPLTAAAAVNAAIERHLDDTSSR